MKHDKQFNTFKKKKRKSRICTPYLFKIYSLCVQRIGVKFSGQDDESFL